MRRWVCGLLAAGVAAAPARPVGAEPTRITAEGGAEADSNVERVEAGRARVAAAVARLGAKLDHRGRLAGGGYAAAIAAHARFVGDRDAESENIALVAGDVRWLRAVAARPVSAGIALAATDASNLTGGMATRTFRTLSGDGLLVLRGGDDRALTFAFGGRQFVYKPDADYDWLGVAASVRLDLTLWQPSGGTRSLELAATLGFEARSYDSPARASTCPDDAPPDPNCSAGTELDRRDRYQRAGLELTLVSPVVAALGYQLAVTDSNSFGQSFARHRITASATTNLPGRLVGTALATVHIDQYLDGLVIESDVLNQQFTSLEDENRSSLQLRLARALSPAWSVELRGAVWRNLGGDTDTAFRRSLVYAGVIYQTPP